MRQAQENEEPALGAEVAELADARDSKSREVTPHVGSIPTFGMHRCEIPTLQR